MDMGSFSSGHTLIEVVVVVLLTSVALLGVLAATANTLNILSRSRAENSAIRLEQICPAIELDEVEIAFSHSTNLRCSLHHNSICGCFVVSTRP